MNFIPFTYTARYIKLIILLWTYRTKSDKTFIFSLYFLSYTVIEPRDINDMEFRIIYSLLNYKTLHNELDKIDMNPGIKTKEILHHEDGWLTRKQICDVKIKKIIRMRPESSNPQNVKLEAGIFSEKIKDLVKENIVLEGKSSWQRRKGELRTRISHKLNPDKFKFIYRLFYELIPEKVFDVFLGSDYAKDNMQEAFVSFYIVAHDILKPARELDFDVDSKTLNVIKGAIKAYAKNKVPSLNQFDLFYYYAINEDKFKNISIILKEEFAKRGISSEHYLRLMTLGSILKSFWQSVYEEDEQITPAEAVDIVIFYYAYLFGSILDEMENPKFKVAPASMKRLMNNDKVILAFIKHKQKEFERFKSKYKRMIKKEEKPFDKKFRKAWEAANSKI